jgi:hypothetical protein
MAEQDINIKITSTANTAGAKQQEKALRDVQDQAKATAEATQQASGPMSLPEAMMGPPRDEILEQAEAEKAIATAMDEAQAAAEKLRVEQGNLDLARAKSLQAAKAQQEAERSVQAATTAAAESSRRLALQIGSIATAEIAKGLAVVNPELAGIAASTAQGAAAAGPWGAALGAVAGSIGAVKQAWEEYKKVVAETDEKIRLNNEAITEHAAKVTQLRLSQGYEKQWRDMGALIEGINQAVRDNIELENARRQAAAAMGGNARDAQESIIATQRQTGVISDKQADAQLATLRAQEAEANRREAIANAEARQKRLQAEMDAAQTAYQAIEDRAEIAQRKLDAAQQNLDRFQGDPNNLDDSAERGKILGELQAAEAEANASGDQIKAAADKVTAAQNALQQGAQLLQVEIEKIASEFDSQGIQDAAKELGEKSKEVMEKGAAEIAKAIEGIEPQTRLEQESLDNLKAMIKDKELDAREAAGAVQQLANLSGLLKGEFGNIIGVVQKTQADLSTITGQISNLASRQQQLSDQVQALARSLPGS